MPWRRLSAVLLFVTLSLSSSVRAADDPIEARMRADVTFLASDACEGRGIETAGINLAADYIAGSLARSGLKPGGEKGSWFQPFTVTGASKLANPGTLTLRGPLGQQIELKAGSDFQVMGLSGSGKVSGPLVFAGYGTTAKDIGYSDFKGLDLAGKIVVLLRHTPRWNNADLPFDGARKDEHATLDRKQALAETNKAAAVIVVNDSTEGPSGDKLMPFDYLRQITTPSGIPGVQMRRSMLDMIFQSSLGMNLKDVEEAIDRDLKPRSMPLPGWTATLETSVTRTVTHVKNVVGVLEGSGPLAKETIVVGAHYDHLGFGGRGSLAKGQGKGQIHHGADDNGSGTTAVLELARRFGAMKERQGRRIVFMTFSAEESGLLGSRYYCTKEPLFALEDTAAMVNLDMVGRLRPDKNTGKDRLIVEGIGTSKGFEALIDKANGNPGFTFTKRPSSGPYSDQHSFYQKKIPVLFFWTDTHEDYHRPTDTADKINVPGMRKVTDLAEKVVTQLATDSKRPEFVQVAGGGKSTGGPTGPRLGLMPNYDEDKKGVLVAGLSAGGGAAQGGVKEGDLIVEIAGRPVTSIATYMAVMAQQTSGQAIEVVILRNEKKLTLKVTPQ